MREQARLQVTAFQRNDAVDAGHGLAGMVGAGLTVGLDDLGGLFQP